MLVETSGVFSEALSGAVGGAITVAQDAANDRGFVNAQNAYYGQSAFSLAVAGEAAGALIAARSAGALAQGNYNLAEANGLSSDAALAEGQTLVIPTGVIRSAHNADTFTPYEPCRAFSA